MQPAAPSAAAARFGVTIEPVADDPAKVVVAVTAASDTVWSAVDSKSASSVLSFHRVQDDAPSIKNPLTLDRHAQPVLGKYQVVGGRLEFRPAFPLELGARYMAHVDLEALPNTWVDGVAPAVPVAYYTVPEPEGRESPHIEAIYPSGSVLPANHLKFYLLFSEPMQRGDIFRFFSLDNLTQGQPVGRPFRHTELWSPDGCRLTLWFHPGRQKTGVNLNVELGPILNKGDRYRLVLSGQWCSERGVPLGEPVEKSFRAGPPDHTQPDHRTWKLTAPQAQTRGPLRCELDEPLDWALLHSQLHVAGPEGVAVAGAARVRDGETVWTFTPEKPWSAGTYRLAIGSVLEDLAGNSIERPFEVDLRSQPAPSPGRVVYREFEVSPTP